MRHWLTLGDSCGLKTFAQKEVGNHGKPLPGWSRGNRTPSLHIYILRGWVDPVPVLRPREKSLTLPGIEPRPLGWQTLTLTTTPGRRTPADYAMFQKNCTMLRKNRIESEIICQYWELNSVAGTGNWTQTSSWLHGQHVDSHGPQTRLQMGRWVNRCHLNMWLSMPHYWLLL